MTNRPFIESQDFDVQMFEDVKVVAPVDHNELMHRDAPDAHPLSAITGLEERLEEIEVATDEEAEEYLFPIPG